MSASPRSPRLFWIVGILLLIGSVVGAGFVLNNGPTPVAKSQATEEKSPPGLVAIGLVDNEPGVTNLYPMQPGRIVTMVEEGFQAKKGNVLLSLDNRLAKSSIEVAKADLTAGRELLRQAEKLPEQHKQKLAQQASAIDIASYQQAIAEEELKIKDKLFKDKQINAQEKAIAEEKVKVFAAQVQAEKGKLRELTLLDPEIDILRARADVSAKQARLDQAELLLQECDLLAPADGLVLRVLAHVGEVLGPNPKSAAIQFAPKGGKIVRAEVLQEWANNVKVGMTVTIEDDTYAGSNWTGKVRRVSPWFTPKRSIMLEPFMFNDVRTLECLIDVEKDGDLRIGQRVRVTIR